ncbi:MAG: ribulose-phosphate 3-epimerase [Syntrophobacterales bacterium]|jgi:ribulose-phosphate 3-epimerase|nr:ribulose-phosphate 3-epimerase [Syntrophobacterales bacterium]
MGRILIAPSILSCKFSTLGQEIREVEKAGADLIHVDVMDGHFVPNITIGPLIVEAAKEVSSVPLDVHLMIENPAMHVDNFAEAGADIITIHAEADNHVFRTIDRIKSLGKKAGISLNPSTPESTLEYVIHIVDMVLIMTVNPGFGGQAYIASMEAKIEETRKIIEASGRDIDIEVDGGIKAANAARVVAAGANILVMGVEIFHSGDYRKKFLEIRNSIAAAQISANVAGT